MSEPGLSGGKLQVVANVKPGERLDRVLAEDLPELSRSQCQQLIRDGLVTVDGNLAKPSQRMNGDERIEVIIPEARETGLVAEDIPLDILYEDGDLIVVNKPAGMVVHPSAGHETGTLVNAILAHCPDITGVGGEKRPGIIHRLDKDTSGIIVVAKSDSSLRMIQGQFKNRIVKKSYCALVFGNVTPGKLMIDAPIGRDPQHRKRMAVLSAEQSVRSREAVTYVSKQRLYKNREGQILSLVECQPVTGRTHQIRVHMAYSGYPIVGDAIYGHRKQTLLTSRHFLHASELTFKRPSDGGELSVGAPLPSELRQLLESLVEI